MLKQDSLSFHFRIMKFKLKLWDLETMDFDGNGTNGFLVFQSFYFNADIMEKWGFFREVTTKIGGKSQKWLRDPNLQLQKSSYIKKKKKIVYDTWQEMVCVVSKMNLIHWGLHWCFQIWNWFVQTNLNWNWKVLKCKHISHFKENEFSRQIIDEILIFFDRMIH